MNYAEDRLFSTSMAINALIDTWTTTLSNNSSKRLWIGQTPPEVKTSVIRAVNWLNHFILREDYLPENAFFSGSVKGANDLPFAYPANRYKVNLTFHNIIESSQFIVMTVSMEQCVFVCL